MMLSMQNKLNLIKNALLNVSDNVYHYTAPSDAKLPYIVWYEEGENGSLEADTHKAEQSINGYIELFTKTEFDPVVDDIQNALNNINVYWSYDSVIFGDPSTDSSVLHHTWGWSLG